MSAIPWAKHTRINILNITRIQYKEASNTRNLQHSQYAVAL